MFGFFRLLIVTAVCLGLVVGLGRNVYKGLVTGKIAHSDTSKFCRRDSNPLGFWTVIAFQAAFVIVILAVWWDVVYKAFAS